MAARANVKAVVLTHQTYRPDGDYTARAAEVRKYFAGEVLIAKDLMEFRQLGLHDGRRGLCRLWVQVHTL
jgi:ribonuclease BN (tRNA processing enzyme)